MPARALMRSCRRDRGRDQGLAHPIAEACRLDPAPALSAADATAKLPRMTVRRRRRCLSLLGVFALLLQAWVPVWAASAAGAAAPAQVHAMTAAHDGCGGHHAHGVGDGRGCCDHDGCCASIAGCGCGVPCAGIALKATAAIAAPQPAGARFSPIRFVLTQVHAAPPLRPPLA